MKTIGVLGGMSWESTAQYYQIMNQAAARRLGGLHSAKILLYSVDFDEYEKLQRKGKWAELTRRMVEAAKRLRAGGADFLVIATNTMHKMADEVQAGSGLPILHIVDATAKRIAADKVKAVGLLGTKFTMEMDFYRGRLERNGLRVIIPGPADRNYVHKVIYDELCKGVIRKKSREGFKKIIRKLAAAGAEGVVLGCTEIPSLVQREDSPIPIYDTTRIHAEAAMDMALRK